MLRRLLLALRGGRVSGPVTAEPVLPEHESAVRSLMRGAGDGAYVAFESLAAAKACPDGAVIFEGDWGGQIYVTAPASLVGCDEATLRQLLVDLDRIAWRVNEGEGAQVFFERVPVGEGVAGGMGGGVVAREVWVHDDFEQLRLGAAIRAVVRGERPQIR